jgi:acetyl/propionyl-CoA carboxylase alpha subunit
VYEGCTVPRFYDTLLAKLVVWGADRPAAIARMARALGEYQVVGVRTTLPVLARIMADEDFGAGRLSTAFLDRKLPAWPPSDGRHALVAIVAAAVGEYERLRGPVPAGAGPAAGAGGMSIAAWRLAAMPGWRGAAR